MRSRSIITALILHQYCDHSDQQQHKRDDVLRCFVVTAGHAEQQVSDERADYKKNSNRNKAEDGVSVNELVSYLQGRWRRVETGEAAGQVSAELMRQVRTGVWVGVAGR